MSVLFAHMIIQQGYFKSKQMYLSVYSCIQDMYIQIWEFSLSPDLVYVANICIFTHGTAQKVKTMDGRNQSYLYGIPPVNLSIPVFLPLNRGYSLVPLILLCGDYQQNIPTVKLRGRLCGFCLFDDRLLVSLGLLGNSWKCIAFALLLAVPTTKRETETYTDGSIQA